jgi:endoglycosylceramidase
VLAAVALSAAVLALPGMALAAPASRPVLPLGHAGRWITDARGRVVLVHGINMVYKLAPYDPAAVGFGADDAAFLRSIGFNAVRVGVIWKAVEPSPGVFDDAYLAQIAATVRTLAAHGIVSLLDFHQDLLNEHFYGEGFPDWAIQDGGLPNPSLGFQNDYLANPALQHAFDQFWNDAPGPGGVGLQQRFAAAWAHVAAYFRGDRSVLGLELFNEPFPGTLWEQCAAVTGCPLFDAKLLAFYKRVDQAIRTVDRRTLVFYEPNVIFNNGAQTALGPLGDPRAVFAFHDYCLTAPSSGTSSTCDTFDDLVFSNAAAHVRSTGDALLETEFGATPNAPLLEDAVARADRNMVGWLEWAYCGCGDPTTTGPGAQEAIVIDPTKPPRGANLVTGTLRALVEPYPQVVAGTPQAWAFDPATRTFTLRYLTARARGRGSFRRGARSSVATPTLVYPRGYAVRVTGAAIVSKRRAGTLVVAACRGARTVTVTVTPGRRRRGSCRARSGRA